MPAVTRRKAQEQNEQNQATSNGRKQSEPIPSKQTPQANERGKPKRLPKKRKGVMSSSSESNPKTQRSENTDCYDLDACIESEIFKTLANVFESAQRLKKASQKRQVIMELNDLYRGSTRKQDHQKLFAASVWQIMQPVMLSEKNPFVEAVFKLFKTAVLTVGIGISSEPSNTSETLFPLVHHISHFILCYHCDTHTSVRVRIMELLKDILLHSWSHDEAGVVNLLREEFLEKVIQTRIRDRVASVRVASVFCLPAFKDNVIARRIFMFMLSFDVSPEARRAAVSLLAEFPSMKSSMYIRMAFDPSEIVRAEAFQQISKLDLGRIASKDQGYQVIQYGLSKSSGRTRDILKHSVLPEWLNQCHNNLVELFQRLDLTNHPKTALHVIDTLYPEGNSKEYQEIDWSFLAAGQKLLDINELTLERTQIWFLLCQRFKHNVFCSNLLLPEAADVQGYLEKLLVVLQTDHSKEEEQDSIPDSVICFAMTLKICDILDFEECTRGNMIKLLKKILLDLAVEDAIIINAAIDLFGKLAEPKPLYDFLVSIIVEFFGWNQSVLSGDQNNGSGDDVSNLRDESPDPVKEKEGEESRGHQSQDETEAEAPGEPETNTEGIPDSGESNEKGNSPTTETVLVPRSPIEDGPEEAETFRPPPKEGNFMDMSRDCFNVTTEADALTDSPLHSSPHPTVKTRSTSLSFTGAPNFAEPISPILAPKERKTPDANSISARNSLNQIESSLPIPIDASFSVRNSNVQVTSTPAPKRTVNDKMQELKAKLAQVIFERHRHVDKIDVATKNGDYLLCHEIHQQIEAFKGKQKEYEEQINRMREMDAAGFLQSSPNISVLRAGNDTTESENGLNGTPISERLAVPGEEASPTNSEHNSLVPGQPALKALMIVLRFLCLTRKITPFLRSVYQMRIIPCLEDEDARVRGYTITLSCTFGLLDRREAKAAFMISLQALQYDICDAQVAGFKSVVDLLIRYGLKFFKRTESEQGLDELPHPFGAGEATDSEVQHGVVALLNKLGTTEGNEPSDGDIELRITGIGKLFLTKRLRSAEVLAEFMAKWIVTRTSSISIADSIAHFVQMFGMIDAENSHLILDAFLIHVCRVAESQTGIDCTISVDEGNDVDPVEEVAKLTELVAESTSPNALARLENGFAIHEQHILNTLNCIKNSLESDKLESVYLASSLKFFTTTNVKTAQEIKKTITELLESNFGYSTSVPQAKKYLSGILKQLARKFGFELENLEELSEEDEADDAAGAEDLSPRGNDSQNRLITSEHENRNLDASIAG